MKCTYRKDTDNKIQYTFLKEALERARLRGDIVKIIFYFNNEKVTLFPKELNGNFPFLYDIEVK